MEMYCPECMAPLTSTDGATAFCRTHGGNYQVLFARHSIVIPPMPAVVSQGGAGPVLPPPISAQGVIPPVLGTRCVQHPDAPAVTLCHNCRAPACATCDFVFPGDIHLCPSCASNSRPQMSSGRRKLIPWSIGLALLGIAGLVGMVVLASASHNKESATAIGAGAMLVSFWPALIGLGLGVASMEKRLRTPGTVWIGIIGNALVVAIWILLMIVGAMKG